MNMREREPLCGSGCVLRGLAVFGQILNNLFSNSNPASPRASASRNVTALRQRLALNEAVRDVLDAAYSRRESSPERLHQSRPSRLSIGRCCLQRSAHEKATQLLLLLWPAFQLEPIGDTLELIEEQNDAPVLFCGSDLFQRFGQCGTFGREFSIRQNRRNLLFDVGPATNVDNAILVACRGRNGSPARTSDVLPDLFGPVITRTRGTDCLPR